ncbi:MAG: hypothetical protein FD144_2615 [Rhodospirillaceae bacterium]|nr:MAG: hypothetical protein FD144_2615 [Rhodospirillaceae bacterium]
MSQATSKIPEAADAIDARIYRNATSALQYLVGTSGSEAEILAVIARMGAIAIGAKALPSAEEAATVESFNKIFADTLGQLRKLKGGAADPALH